MNYYLSFYIGVSYFVVELQKPFVKLWLRVADASTGEDDGRATEATVAQTINRISTTSSYRHPNFK